MRLIAHRVADTVRRHHRWGSTLVASFNPISLWELRKIDPTILRGYIWSRRSPSANSFTLLQLLGQGPLVRSGQRQLQPPPHAQDEKQGRSHLGMGR